MKKRKLNYTVTLLLLASIIITGILGYVQSRLDLRRFAPHKNFAYATLILATIHNVLNWGRLWNFLCRKRGKNQEHEKN